MFGFYFKTMVFEDFWMVIMYLRHFDYFNDNIRCLNGYLRYFHISCICISIIWVFFGGKNVTFFYKKTKIREKNLLNFLGFLFLTIWWAKPPNPPAHGGSGRVGGYMTHLKASRLDSEIGY